MSPRRTLRAISLAAVLALILFPSSPVLWAQISEQTLVERISSQLEAGQIDAAIDEARRAVEQYPKSATLYQLFGAALFKKGAAGEARQAFQRAIALDPKVVQNYFNLALVDLSEKNYPEAEKSLETFVHLEPGNAQAHLLLGRAYHNLNLTLPAIEQFKKALALSPQLPLVHYHLGYAYQSQGNLTAALAEYQQEMKQNPGFPDVYWLAGNIELGRGNLDAAESLFRKGLSVKPQAVQAEYGLARVFVARKQLAEAEQALHKVIELEPDHVEAHYALARTYQQLGKNEDAAREYKIVAELHARGKNQQSGIAGQRP